MSNTEARERFTRKIALSKCDTLVISSSYGNDSIALCQHVHELGLVKTHRIFVIFSDTGWAAPGWLERVEKGEAWVSSLGFTPIKIKSMGMPALVRMKKAFPAQRPQICSAFLKGYPYLEWVDDIDPTFKAMTLIGKRRSESLARANTSEFIFNSEYHGGRTVWHPLYLKTEVDRNELITSASWDVLPHRSLECNPCVNANRADFKRLTPFEIKRTNDLEVEIARPMFRPKRFNAVGIQGVIHWAKYGKGVIPDEELTCGAEWGCGS